MSETQTETSTAHATETKVTKDMTMGFIVAHFPETVDVMLKYGLHCIGCDVSYSETLQEGCAGHGMSDETIEKMVSEMNGQIVPADDSKIVQLTPRAADKIRELMEKEGKKGYFLRVGVIEGGCSGYSYVLDFEKDKRSDDEELSEEGLPVIMSKSAVPMLRGLKVDYRDGLQGAGFKIVNPNAKATCGCGSSFA